MRKLTLLIWCVGVLFLSGCASQYHADGHNSSVPFDALEAAKTRISLGLTYLKNGNYKQAKFNLDKALTFAPRLAEAHYSMAYYYQVVGETQLADTHYQDAMSYDPNNPDIANSYGAFLCQQGDFAEAEKYFLQAVNTSRYNSAAETYENLALCSQNQGMIDKAIEYLNTALKHQPTRAKSMMLLAQLQASDHQWEAARRTLRRYESIARVSPEVLWLLVKIEQALGNNKAAIDYGNILVDMYPGHVNASDYLNNLKPVLETADTHTTQAEADSPATSGEAADEMSASSDESANAGGTEADFHIVEPGENLFRISLKYNVRMQQLIKWNGLNDVSTIPVGKKLYIVDPAKAGQETE